ncbi:hypothetical protein BTG_23630 [Bacillus thuringiensis HD-771]|uniref:Uncharacterized protein n=1 Tax=Bacillus thuringiensis HD-771 TaxID=1218175 RepID=A0A9W3JDB9_BACTU|nr:hypothetical protein BTG_23630 [Bacillus thuringiensis HD-771]
MDNEKRKRLVQIVRGDGASDVEALFASQEEAKPPNNLAAGDGQ